MKKRTGSRRTWKRVQAFLMAVVMVLGTIGLDGGVIGGMRKVLADDPVPVDIAGEGNGFTITAMALPGSGYSVDSSGVVSGVSRQNGSIEVKVKFECNNDKTTDYRDNGRRTWYYDLSGMVNSDDFFLSGITGVASGDLADGAGTWYIENNKVVMNIAESWLQGRTNGVSGYFQMDMNFSEEKLGDATSTTLEFPGGNPIVVGFKDKYTITKVPTTLTTDDTWLSETSNKITRYKDDATITDATRYPIGHKIDITCNVSSLNNMIIYDEAGTEQIYDGSSFELKIGNATYNATDISSFLIIDDTTHKFQFNLAGFAASKGITSIDVGTQIILTYNTLVNLEDFDMAKSERKTSTDNTAYFTLGNSNDKKSPEKKVTYEIDYTDRPREVTKNAAIKEGTSGAGTIVQFNLGFGTDASGTEMPMNGETITDTATTSGSGKFKLASDIVLTFTDSGGEQHTYKLYDKESGTVYTGFNNGSYGNFTLRIAPNESFTGSQEIFQLEFSDTFDSAVAEHYVEREGAFTISYELAAAPDDGYAGKMTISNTVSEKTGTTEVTSKSSAEISMLIGVLDADKVCSEIDEEGNIIWKIKVEIEPERTVSGLVIEEGSVYYVDASYQTTDMGIKWNDLIIKKGSESGSVLTLGTDYSVDSSLKSINFIRPVDEDIYIYVKTCPDANIAENYEICNNATVKVSGNTIKNVTANSTYTLPPSTNYSVEKECTEKDDSTGIYTWQVTVNPNQIAVSPNHDVWFEDVLPDNVKLHEQSFNDWRGTFDYNLKVQFDSNYSDIFYLKVDGTSGKIGPVNLNDACKGDPDFYVDGPTTSSTILEGISEHMLTITYQTELADDIEAVAAAAGGAVTLTNKAYIYDNGTSPTPTKEAEATETYELKVLSKEDITTSTEIEDVGGKYYIEYKIIVNEAKATLNNGNTLKLYDQLDSNVQLSSYTITDEVGTSVSDVELNYKNSTNELELKIPDAATRVVTYKVEVLDPRGTDGSYGVLKNFENTAVLRGVQTFQKTVQSQHKFKEASAGLTGETLTLKLKKWDSDLIHTLEGAKFAVYRLTSFQPDNADDKMKSFYDPADFTEEDAKQKGQQYVQDHAAEGVIDYRYVFSDGSSWGPSTYNFYYLKEEYQGTVSTGADGIADFASVVPNFAVVYYWKEVKAPTGYVLDETKHYFTLYNQDSQSRQNKRQAAEDAVNKIILFPSISSVEIGRFSNGHVFTATNQTANISFTKYGRYNEEFMSNSGEKEPLAGAKFSIAKVDDQDNVIAKATSDADGKVTFGQLDPGTYIVKEMSTGHANYKLLDEPWYVTVTATGNSGLMTSADGTSGTDELVNEVYRGDIEFTKVNESNPEESLAGSTYGLYRKVSSYARTSSRTADRVSTGTAEGVSGSLPSTAEIITIENEPYALLAKATSDAAGKVKFSGVITGVEYLVKELEAPNGYYVSEQPMLMTMKVESNGTVKMQLQNNGNGTVTQDANGNITWLEPVVIAEVSKVDGSGSALSGAKLHIEDESGTVVESWTSDGTVHKITGKLVSGKTYYLVEDAAPSGYKKASKIRFDVSAQAGPNEETENVIRLKMVDTKDTGGDSDGSDSDDSEGSTDGSSMTDSTSVTSTAPKTGDNTPYELAIIAFLFVMSGLCLVMSKRKADKKSIR